MLLKNQFLPSAATAAVALACVFSVFSVNEKLISCVAAASTTTANPGEFLSNQEEEINKMGESRPRQNFAAECEAELNRQINVELYAMYSYLSMANYFDRDDVALPGFKKFFQKSAHEELEHAQKLMQYQNTRGGRVVLAEIKKPERDTWGSCVDAMKHALKMEKDVNQSLLDLHGVSSKFGDANLSDFLESEYLQEQVDAIKELSDYVTKLERVGPGVGELMLDKELGSE